MDFLEKLKQDPNCLYIYNWGPYIYGLSKEPTEYLVVVKDDGKEAPENPVPGLILMVYQEEGIRYNIWNISSWFKKVLNGDIDCWIAACLNKKFIVKEHVKLMMTTNPLSLRNRIDADIKFIQDPEYEEFALTTLGGTIRDCKFASQIIDNHKIVNFKEANAEYETLKENQTRDVFEKLMDKPYKLLKAKTDEILRKSKIDKILQKQKDG